MHPYCPTPPRILCPLPLSVIHFWPTFYTLEGLFNCYDVIHCLLIYCTQLGHWQNTLSHSFPCGGRLSWGGRSWYWSYYFPCGVRGLSLTLIVVILRGRSCIIVVTSLSCNLFHIFFIEKVMPLSRNGQYHHSIQASMSLFSICMVLLSPQ